MNKLDEILDKVLTTQYNLITTNDLKNSLAYEINILLKQAQIDETNLIFDRMIERIGDLGEPTFADFDTIIQSRLAELSTTA